ncbi:GNAT family N-acetyltransferase [Bifidobacterium simiiventris]|uniref:GNAT family N-acetyltransferase n=1 Tax=Bifidobacterium simiiventris TaxID=2834434 RepID=UPI001C577CFC|nr:GNAT family N-acetyltransferase [Bifidobacterium simiiventris]MBW3078953.1 GNAT family N-acetyltransferase [Bifidobacterium simiiventris]
MSETAETPTLQEISRELPPKIVIPEIKGEMVHLRPATIEDLPRLDELDAYYNASRITGKDPQAERAVVHAWVRRSVAWTNGLAASESGVGDPESRRTMAWAVLTDSDHDDDGQIDAQATDNVIGMVFLIDIDGWARSARIQVVLGKDYRGRGYSRDMMPRVMTYGFAPEPAGLGMHRIWVAVPEKNTRSLSVYKSLGFVQSGTSRDALWDAENGRYQDLIVLDTLFDEYDPIRSLDAFGMHVIEDNPGMREALAMREHSVTIQQKRRDPAGANETRADASPNGDDDNDELRKAAYARIGVELNGDDEDAGAAVRQAESAPSDTVDGDSTWPYGQSERKTSKNAWWRNLGLSRKRETEEDR